MKKTTDEELKQWHYNYLSTAVSWRYVGDEDYAETFRGEGKSLLYDVKKAMIFNKLGQLRGVTQFADGTIIEAISVFGQDIITIDVTASVRKEKHPECAVKLINVPLVVPPMKYLGEGIGKTEVEGYDYIKTYYEFTNKDCADCLWIRIPCPSKTLSSDLGMGKGSKCYRSFIYDGVKKYNYQGGQVEFDPYYTDALSLKLYGDKNIKGHCIVGACQGQIVKYGLRDKVGTYFLWKAYTEWNNVDPTNSPYYRYGLGYMLMEFKILDPKNPNPKTPVCTAYNVVKVDCCVKKEKDRQVYIQWDGLTCIISEWCDVSTVRFKDFLFAYGQGLYADFIVTPGFGCPNFEWTLGGPGKLTTNPPTNNFATYVIGGAENIKCDTTATISVKDRCGTQASVKVISCCQDNPAPVSIVYSSLQMGCNTSQNFSASGGCPPFSWSMSGGGSIVTNPDSTSTYTSPGTNPSCSANPTITVKDCCGASASIQIAVNCYSPPGFSAYVIANATNCWCYKGLNLDYCGAYGGCIEYNKVGYLCDGSSMGSSCWGPYSGFLPPETSCSGGCALAWTVFEGTACYTYNLYEMTSCDTCDSDQCRNLCCYQNNVTCAPPTGCSYNVPCDTRTDFMKSMGCCPLNPQTGLPF